MNEEYYVQIPNKMFAFDTEYYATSDELIVYYTLGTLVHARNTNFVQTNIDLLHSLLELDNCNISRGKTRIRKALYGLQSKGYLSFSFTGVLKNATRVDIHITSSKDKVFTKSVKSGNWNYYGYTEVKDSLIEKAATIEQIKVLIYVRWREGINYAISYFEWEKVLGVSHQTAVKIIRHCVEKGLIIKQLGDYYITEDGIPRQMTNMYRIKTNDDVKEMDMEKEINTTVKSMALSDKSTETRENAWFKTGDEGKLVVEDFYIYLTSSCTVLKEHAKKRFDGLSKTDGGSKLITNNMKKAQDRIDRERNEKKLEKINESLQLQNAMDMNEKPHVYIKQVETEDSSFLFNDNDKSTIDEVDEFPMFA